MPACPLLGNLAVREIGEFLTVGRGDADAVPPAECCTLLVTLRLFVGLTRLLARRSSAGVRRGGAVGLRRDRAVPGALDRPREAVALVVEVRRLGHTGNDLVGLGVVLAPCRRRRMGRIPLGTSCNATAD